MNKDYYSKDTNYDYIEYLTLKKMNQKIVNSGKSGIELENEIYTKNNTILTEKEKIYFEVSRIYEKIKDKKKLNTLLRDNTSLYLSMNKFIKQLLNFQKNNFCNYNDIKTSIFQLQVDLNMKTGFYSIVPSLLEKYNNGKGAMTK